VIQEITAENIRGAFTYKRPSEHQVPKYEAITEALIAAGEVILANAPRSPLRTRALNALFDARMLANASIATEEVK
jgi:hypothetical protein